MNLLSVFIFSLCLIYVSCIGLREEFTWSRISYQTGNQRFKRQGISQVIEDPSLVNSGIGETLVNNGITSVSSGGSISGNEYNYENNIPMGANVWRNKLFITVPRRRFGVTSTLNYVPLDSRQRHNVPLIPYPNLEINTYPDTSGNNENFVSIYRVAIDPCDRLWFVDTGRIEVANVSRIRPATIGVIDLHTDRLIHSFPIPDNYITSASGLASITIDVTKNTCNDAYAYIPDLGAYALIVYSLRQNRAWRVSHNYFFLEPAQGEFLIAGHRFQWNDGVFSLELTDIKSNGYRDMYFHSMAGSHMYKVSTRVLRNETLATRSFHENDFQIVGDRGPLSQTSTADIHQQSGIMFLSLVNQNGVACWNINKPLNTISLVDKNDRTMIYPCDLKIVGDRVYVLTNTMPEFLYGRLNYDTTNFRVWSNSVRNAVAGTQCAQYVGGNGNNYEENYGTSPTETYNRPRPRPNGPRRNPF